MTAATARPGTRRRSAPPGASALVARIQHRVRRRAVAVVAALALAAAVACGVTLVTGAAGLSLAELAAALAGGPQGEGAFVVWQLRVPRLLLGVLAGLAFGLSGALLQPTLRNPLASPDVLGISGGAAAAACFAVVVLGAGSSLATVFALAGGLGVAVIIAVLARGDGRGAAAALDPTRFLLVGVACAFLATALTSFLLTRADDRVAQQALVWTVGGLGRADWAAIGMLAVALAVLAPAAAWCGPRVRQLALGDELAAAFGVDVPRSRLVAVGVAVTLAAVATSAAGPIAFVAFLSAPIARRLVGHGSIALAVSGLVGVVIVLVADLVAQHFLPSGNLPAGIVTSIIGGPVLLWIVAAKRRGSTA